MPVYNTIPTLKDKIGAIVSQYVTDEALCSECVDKVMVDVESGDLVTLVGDADLVTAIKNNFGNAALLTLRNVPSTDTVVFEPATVANLSSYEQKMAKEVKLKTIVDTIEAATGKTLELPDSFA